MIIRIHETLRQFGVLILQKKAAYQAYLSLFLVTFSILFVLPASSIFAEERAPNIEAREAVPEEFVEVIDRGPLGNLWQKAYEGNEAPDEGFIALLLILGAWVSEDLATITAGLLATQGYLSLGKAILIAIIGIVTGDLALYAVGRFFGKRLLKRAPLRWWLSRRAVQKSERWFNRYGLWIAFGACFVPGARFATFFTAGVLRAHALRFSFAVLLGGSFWAMLLVTASMYFGQTLIEIFEVYRVSTIILIPLVIATLYFSFKVFGPLFSFYGRRLYVSRWRRCTCWEFWPSWLLYLPIGFYYAFLTLKYKGVRVPLYANPKIPASGIIGESKSTILSQLNAMDVAPWTLVSQKEHRTQQWQCVLDFQQKHDLEYPLVFKPDEGQRGLGVTIIHSAREGRSYLARAQVDTIVQAYIAGPEFGIFYYRYPNAKKGDIFSITEKKPIKVKGDGIHNLEHLILRDKRAVCLAPFFLRQHAHHLEDIPQAGELVPLVHIGTHALGALFLDGNHFKTSELVERIDHITQPFSGFYLGRYDIRVPSVEALRAGKDISVIELNGLTAEATHIYDPQHNYFYGVRTLAKQWRIAFEIGSQNRSLGSSCVSFKELLRQLLTAFIHQKRIRRKLK